MTSIVISAVANGATEVQEVTVTVNITDRLAFDVDQLDAVCGLGRTRAFEEIQTGRLKARKAGRRTLVLREDLEDWLRALPEAGRS